FQILEKLDGTAAEVINALRPFFFCNVTLCGMEVMVARTGYTGEDGVEIFVPMSDAPKLWESLLTVGKQDGLLPVGLGARDTLRLEARLSLYGNELNEETTPFESGIGWTVKLDAGDFIGRAALEEKNAQTLTRCLVGIEMVGRGIARSGYNVLNDSGEVIGHVASGSPSPTLGSSIGLAFVPPEYRENGTSLQIDCRGKKIEAKVIKTPFYRRAGSK
ncbi:MAG: glycine cleavage system aminomethyltransferase GcvT, partial [Polyangiaceae bacterium]|nr:glycine cleavage system aminomethyltransferase GcvT [Polyangiaceae bacterium]